MMFENPAMLLIVPVVFFLMWFTGKRKNRGGIIFSSPDKYFIENKKEKFRLNKDYVFFKFINFLFWVSLVFIAFSFSIPEAVKKDIRYLSKGNDFFILLDVSPSMAIAEDGKTRLDKAKEAAEHIVASCGNDYPGLILFGSNSVVSLLPTPDRNSFLNRLKQTNVMELGDATAIGTAIGTAIYFLKNSQQKEKRVILISDGDANYGELSPFDASLMAAKTGIKINCIAIGHAGSERSIIIDTSINDKVTGKISGDYHPEILKKVAEISGGYFLENPGKQVIGRVTASLKTEEEKTETFFTKKDLSGYFFIPGILILLITMVLKIVLLKEIVT